MRFLGALLIASGLVVPGSLPVPFLLQAADETIPGLGDAAPFDPAAIRDVVIVGNPNTVGRVLTVVGWTTVTVVALSALVGLFVFILFAAERTSRRGCGPVSIIDSRTSQRKA